jgi:DNA-binding transcriptional ArsR family regulator
MQTDQLSATFAALADPTRRAILARLASGEYSVTELAEPFEMSMPAVSKHLAVLERAGLIARGRDAQRRPCRIEAAPIREVASWAEQYRAIWEARLDRLDTYLHELTMKTRAGSGAGRGGPASDRARRGAGAPADQAEEKRHGRQPRRK